MVKIERKQLSMPPGPLTDAYQALQGVYVETRRHEEALSAVKRTILSGATSGRHSGLALIGPTGSGKTATVQHAERWLRTELGLSDSDPSPLPIVLMTTRSTGKSVVNNVLRAGRDPLAGRRTQDEGEMHLRETSPLMEVQGFAFDELHNAFVGKSESESLRMSLTMKTLVNSLSKPVIAVGINGLEDFIDGHPELRQRFERRVFLEDPRVTRDDTRYIHDMRMLLRAMGAAVPCEPDCSLSGPDMLARLLLACECRFGSVVNMVRSACAFGAMERQPRMHLAHFCAAYREVAPRDKRQDPDNPFLMPVDTVKVLVAQLQTRLQRSVATGAKGSA